MLTENNSTGNIGMINNEISLVHAGLFGYEKIGLALADEDGKVERVNDLFVHLFQQDKEKLVGVEIQELFEMIHRTEEFSDYKRNNIPEGDYVLIKSGENFIPVRISVIYGFSGTEKTMLVVHDITDILDQIKKNYRYNKKMDSMVDAKTKTIAMDLEKEKHLNGIKSKFISTASHEFRTPLSAVATSASLIEKYIVQDEKEKIFSHLEKIKKSVKLMTSFLDDFIMLDQLEQGKIKSNIQLVDIGLFMHDFVDEFKDHLKSGQRIDFKFTGDNRITIDSHFIRYILSTFLGNASKFSGENSKIILVAEAKRKSLKIEVEDFGIGIPDRDQERVFELFFRGKNARDYIGTGLGLNIVSRFLSIMNGDVSFTSKEEEGTKFTIRIPYF